MNKVKNYSEWNIEMGDYLRAEDEYVRKHRSGERKDKIIKMITFFNITVAALVILLLLIDMASAI